MDLKEQIKNAYATPTEGGYPGLVKKLIAIGVQSYTVDVATATTLYRFAEGQHVLHPGNETALPIADQFQQEAFIAALRATQQGQTTYPEFLADIAKAGVRFYEATFVGEHKRVTYIGTRGVYEEEIPV